MNISVIIPTYNRAQWVRRAIDTALSQTFQAAEIVVVDDGSTDDTAEVVRGLGGAGRPEIRYIHQTNAGPSAARNRGIREARGQWIAFLDADDEWLEHKLERQAAGLRRDPELAWSVANCARLEGNREIPPRFRGDLVERAERDGHVPFFQACIEWGAWFITSGFVIRTSVLREMEGFDESLIVGEDTDLWWRIALRHPKIHLVPEVCWRYRIDTPQSLTKGTENREAKLQSICRTLQRAREVGPDAERTFYPLGHRLAQDFILRAAGGELTIRSEVLKEARRLYPPGIRRRALLALLACLPAPVGRRVVRRFSL